MPGVSPFLRILQKISAEPILYIPAESLCWLLLGIFFGSLAQLRKSANYGIAAALAINFGVWVLLSHQDATAFFERPQLWLIPLGLIVLVAEFINRRRLGFWPSLWLRYAGLLCIYLSSTFEMFMAGLGSNPIYPIILALLAVAGMMLGILFRVRAFLLSGFMASDRGLRAIFGLPPSFTPTPGSGGCAASCWASSSWPCSRCSRSIATKSPRWSIT